jgi:hypothetical protein
MAYPDMSRLAIIADDLSGVTDCGALMNRCRLAGFMPSGGYDT